MNLARLKKRYQRQAKQNLGPDEKERHKDLEAHKKFLQEYWQGDEHRQTLDGLLNLVLQDKTAAKQTKKRGPEPQKPQPGGKPVAEKHKSLVIKPQQIPVGDVTKPAQSPSKQMVDDPSEMCYAPDYIKTVSPMRRAELQQTLMLVKTAL